MPDSTRRAEHTRRRGAVLSRVDTYDHDTRRLRTQPHPPARCRPRRRRPTDEAPRVDQGPPREWIIRRREAATQPTARLDGDAAA